MRLVLVLVRLEPRLRIVRHEIVELTRLRGCRARVVIADDRGRVRVCTDRQGTVILGAALQLGTSGRNQRRGGYKEEFYENRKPEAG